MPPLPKNFSFQAGPIQSALSEGRTDDAQRLAYEILMTGKADHVVQKIAAEMIIPPKRGRGRKKALTRHWYEIGEDFNNLRDGGMKYEVAMQQVADKYGFSESHVRKAVSEYDEAREAQAEATAPLYEEWLEKERTRK